MFRYIFYYYIHNNIYINDYFSFCIWVEIIQEVMNFSEKM